MFVCIWCEDKCHGICKDNKLPWHFYHEMQHFKNTTLNNKVLMGKNTFLSIGKPLIQRTNYVVSKSPITNITGINVISDLGNFIDQYKNSSEIIYVIGGKKIYEQLLPYSKKLIISKLKNCYDCDTFFNPDLSNFRLVNKTLHQDFDIEYYEASN